MNNNHHPSWEPGELEKLKGKFVQFHPLRGDTVTGEPMTHDSDNLVIGELMAYDSNVIVIGREDCVEIWNKDKIQLDMPIKEETSFKSVTISNKIRYYNYIQESINHKSKQKPHDWENAVIALRKTIDECGVDDFILKEYLYVSEALLGRGVTKSTNETQEDYYKNRRKVYDDLIRLIESNDYDLNNLSLYGLSYLLNNIFILRLEKHANRIINLDTIKAIETDSRWNDIIDVNKNKEEISLNKEHSYTLWSNISLLLMCDQIRMYNELLNAEDFDKVFKEFSLKRKSVDEKLRYLYDQSKNKDDAVYCKPSDFENALSHYKTKFYKYKKYKDEFKDDTDTLKFFRQILFAANQNNKDNEVWEKDRYRLKAFGNTIDASLGLYISLYNSIDDFFPENTIFSDVKKDSLRNLAISIIHRYCQKYMMADPNKKAEKKKGYLEFLCNDLKILKSNGLCYDFGYGYESASGSIGNDLRLFYSLSGFGILNKDNIKIGKYIIESNNYNMESDDSENNHSEKKNIKYNNLSVCSIVISYYFNILTGDLRNINDHLEDVRELKYYINQAQEIIKKLTDKEQKDINKRNQYLLDNLEKNFKYIWQYDTKASLSRLESFNIPIAQLSINDLEVFSEYKHILKNIIKSLNNSKDTDKIKDFYVNNKETLIRLAQKYGYLLPIIELQNHSIINKNEAIQYKSETTKNLYDTRKRLISLLTPAFKSLNDNVLRIYNSDISSRQKSDSTYHECKTIFDKWNEHLLLLIDIDIESNEELHFITSSYIEMLKINLKGFFRLFDLCKRNSIPFFDSLSTSEVFQNDTCRHYLLKGIWKTLDEKCFGKNHEILARHDKYFVKFYEFIGQYSDINADKVKAYQQGLLLDENNEVLKESLNKALLSSSENGKLEDITDLQKRHYPKLTARLFRYFKGYLNPIMHDNLLSRNCFEDCLQEMRSVYENALDAISSNGQYIPENLDRNISVLLYGHYGNHTKWIDVHGKEHEEGYTSDDWKKWMNLNPKENPYNNAEIGKVLTDFFKPSIRFSPNEKLGLGSIQSSLQMNIDKEQDSDVKDLWKRTICTDTVSVDFFGNPGNLYKIMKSFLVLSKKLNEKNGKDNADDRIISIDTMKSPKIEIDGDTYYKIQIRIKNPHAVPVTNPLQDNLTGDNSDLFQYAQNCCGYCDYSIECTCKEEDELTHEIKLTNKRFDILSSCHKEAGGTIKETLLDKDPGGFCLVFTYYHYTKLKTKLIPEYYEKINSH